MPVEMDGENVLVLKVGIVGAGRVAGCPETRIGGGQFEGGPGGAGWGCFGVEGAVVHVRLPAIPHPRPVAIPAPREDEGCCNVIGGGGVLAGL